MSTITPQAQDELVSRLLSDKELARRGPDKARQAIVEGIADCPPHLLDGRVAYLEGVRPLVEYGAYQVGIKPDTKKPDIRWVEDEPYTKRARNAWSFQSKRILTGKADKIGIFPATLDAIAVDVDGGDPEIITSAYPPAYITHSKTPGHQHLWYAVEEDGALEFGKLDGQSYWIPGQRIASKFDFDESTPKIDVLGRKGYAVIHHVIDGRAMVDALETARQTGVGMWTPEMETDLIFNNHAVRYDRPSHIVSGGDVQRDQDYDAGFEGRSEYPAVDPSWIPGATKIRKIAEDFYLWTHADGTGYMRRRHLGEYQDLEQYTDWETIKSDFSEMCVKGARRSTLEFTAYRLLYNLIESGYDAWTELAAELESRLRELHELVRESWADWRHCAEWWFRPLLDNELFARFQNNVALFQARIENSTRAAARKAKAAVLAANGMTRGAIAEAVGVTERTVRRWGISANPVPANPVPALASGGSLAAVGCGAQGGHSSISSVDTRMSSNQPTAEPKAKPIAEPEPIAEPKAKPEGIDIDQMIADKIAEMRANKQAEAAQRTPEARLSAIQSQPERKLIAERKPIAERKANGGGFQRQPRLEAIAKILGLH